VGNLKGWTSGWSDCNENTTTEQALDIRIKTNMDTSVSNWDKGGNDNGGFGWGKVKSDF
jgi:hypothetical protein